jgi:hypothetical protein
MITVLVCCHSYTLRNASELCSTTSMRSRFSKAHEFNCHTIMTKVHNPHAIVPLEVSDPALSLLSSSVFLTWSCMFTSAHFLHLLEAHSFYSVSSCAFYPRHYGSDSSQPGLGTRDRARVRVADRKSAVPN